MTGRTDKSGSEVTNGVVLGEYVADREDLRAVATFDDVTDFGKN